MSELQATVERSQPLYRQLLEFYSQAIDSGRLAAGDRLPTTQQLVKQYGVSITTIQGALDQLRQRGLVERVPGRGTVVSAGVRSRTWGVVFGEPILGSPDRRVYALVADLLARRLAGRGGTLRIYHPDAQGRLDGTALDLARDLGAGLLRVLLPLAATTALERILEPLYGRIPVTSGRVWSVDQRALVALGAGHLRARGFRRPAVLACADAASVRQGLADAGVDAEVLGPANTERAGFAAVSARLGAAGDVPDSWLVCDDNACRGALMAMLWHGQRPGATGLVTHANAGIDLPAPIPLTRLECDPADMAAAVLAVADAQLAGAPVEGVVVTPRLVVGTSCGETP
jgi:hypothetical protein